MNGITRFQFHEHQLINQLKKLMRFLSLKLIIKLCPHVQRNSEEIGRFAVNLSYEIHMHVLSG